MSTMAMMAQGVNVTELVPIAIDVADVKQGLRTRIQIVYEPRRSRLQLTATATPLSVLRESARTPITVTE